MLYTPYQALDALGELRVISIELLRNLGIPVDPGKRDRAWANGYPIGVTEHYTAGTGWAGSARWLNGTANTGSSCHLLVADRMPDNIPESIVKALKKLGFDVLVILLAPLHRGTWHGNWSNSNNVGIENRNAGILRGTKGDWKWWPKNWTTKFDAEALGKTPMLIDGKWWEPYTVGQIRANILLGQMFKGYAQSFGGEMDPRWFIPHSGVKETKMDTGRAYPLDLVREAVFEDRDLDTLEWLGKYEADPVGFVDELDEDMDLEFLEELAWRQQHRDEDLPEHELLVCEEIPSANLQMLVQNGNWKNELDAVRRGLSMLDYVVGGAGPELDKDTALAVWMFQKMMGLKPDKIPGEVTQKALVKRLKTFQLWQG